MASTPATLDNATVSDPLGNIEVVDAMRDLFTELGQDRADRPTFSRSNGLSFEDIIIGYAVYQHATA